MTIIWHVRSVEIFPFMPSPTDGLVSLLCDYAHVCGAIALTWINFGDSPHSQNTCSVPTGDEGTLLHATVTQKCRDHMVATMSNARWYTGATECTTNKRATHSSCYLETHKMRHPQELSMYDLRYEISTIKFGKKNLSLERSVQGLRLTPDVGRRCTKTYATVTTHVITRFIFGFANDWYSSYNQCAPQ